MNLFKGHIVRPAFVDILRALLVCFVIYLASSSLKEYTEYLCASLYEQGNVSKYSRNTLMGINFFVLTFANVTLSASTSVELCSILPFVATKFTNAKFEAQTWH
jgi:hypothetical protein